MDLSTSVATAIRTGAMQALATAIDVGGAGAVLEFYATTRPAPNGSPGGSPLVAVVLDYPCGAASAGVLILSDTEFAQIVASGEALWARLKDGATTWIGDFSVGTPAMHTSDPATAEVIIASTQLYIGAFLALVGAQIAGN
jgi:hypothetical protein